MCHRHDYLQRSAQKSAGWHHGCVFRSKTLNVKSQTATRARRRKQHKKENKLPTVLFASALSLFFFAPPRLVCALTSPVAGTTANPADWVALTEAGVTKGQQLFRKEMTRLRLSMHRRERYAVRCSACGQILRPRESLRAPGDRNSQSLSRQLLPLSALPEIAFERSLSAHVQQDFGTRGN
jgi:hypothetical protein